MAKRKRTPEQNEQRRLRANMILKLTGNSKLANASRDWSNATFNKRIKDYDLPEQNLKRYYLPEKRKRVEILEKTKKSTDRSHIYKDISLENIGTIDETKFKNKQERYKVFYNIVRNAGYTPAEAKRLKTKKVDDLSSLFQANKVFNRESRINRWSALSKKGKKLDSSIVDLAEQINVDNGLDPDDSYGYGVTYAWYINGGKIETYLYSIAPVDGVPDIYTGFEPFK